MPIINYVFSILKQKTIKLILSIALLFIITPSLAFAVARYTPGETLNPACGPTDADCAVSAPLYSSASLDIGSSPQAGYYTATSTTATSTFAGGLDLTNLNVPTLKNVIAWGDSFTEQNITASSSYPSRLTSKLGLMVTNQGVSGNTSSQVLSRFLVRPDLWGNLSVLWIGQNDIDHGIVPDDILSNVATLYGNLTTNPKQFLILGLTMRWNNGTASSTEAKSYNSSLQSTYPNNYLEVNDVLLSSCNVPGSTNTTGWYASTTQDQIDCGYGKTPTSLRYDSEHLNDAGYEIIANIVYAKLKIMNIAYWNSAINNISLAKIFATPYSIGSLSPSDGNFTGITTTATTSTNYFASQVNIGRFTVSPYELSDLNVSGRGNTPATSGVVSNSILSVQTDIGQSLYFGGYRTAPFGIWMNVSGRTGLSQVFPLIIQPNGGSVGIGTTSPSSKLTVNGSSYFAGAVLATSTVKFSGLATLAAANALCIDATGNITTAAVAACSGVSSQRYKHDITNLDLGLQTINALRPVSFKFNEGYGDNGLSSQFGLIAEEVNTVDTRLTTLDKDGQVNAVRYDFLAPILIKAIQEQQLQINMLMGSTTSSISSSGFLQNIFNQFLVLLSSVVVKVGEFHIQDKICIDDECYSKEVLRQVLRNSGATPLSNSAASTNSENSTTISDSSATTTPSTSEVATTTPPVQTQTATTTPEIIPESVSTTTLETNE